MNAALEDERHNGWGYTGANHLAPTVRARLDRAVVAVANDLGLSREELFHWTDSKYGRWLTDQASGTDATQALVRSYLNAETIRVLAAARAED